MKIRYEMMISCAEHQTFIIEVPELPGYAVDGEAYQGAVQNVEVVLREWIETVQALG